MNQTGKVITREVLYEAVWSKTLQVLAREWNTTYSRLVEACECMEIPRPDPGYWPLIARGFAVDKQPMPDKQEGTPDKFELLPQGSRRERKLDSGKSKVASSAGAEELMSTKATTMPGNEGNKNATTVPKAQERELDLGALAQKAVLDIIRQRSQIDFWRENISAQVPKFDFAKWLGLDDGVNITEHQLLRAVKSVQKDFRTFCVSVSEKTDRYNPSYSQHSVAIHLRDGCEWKDAWEEAWSFSEKPNPHCLSDNALRLYEWAKSAKNTGQMMDQNKIGAQARLRGTYRYVEEHLEEIQMKADANLQWEREDHTWRGKIRIYFKHVERRFYHYGPLNPTIGLDVREITHLEVERFKKWLYGEILKPGFPDANQTVGLFDIRDRKTLKSVFGKLPADCGIYGPIPDFFKSLRIIEGFELRHSFEDGGGPWLVVGLPDQGCTWEDVKIRLRAKAADIPLAKRYKLSADSLALLQWITDLRKDEYLLKLTPTIEDRLKEEIGIETDWEEANVKAYLELLVEEINENTEFRLRTIPWQHYSDNHTRILVNRKRADLEEIVQAIRILGLRYDKSLSDEKVRTAIKGMIGEN